MVGFLSAYVLFNFYYLGEGLSPILLIMIRLLNLFSGFAFVGFGFLAFNLIPEFRNYIGQELVAWWIFYSLMFCLTFIIWALTYFYMRDAEEINEDILDNLEQRLEMIKLMEQQQFQKKCAYPNKRQMEMDL